MTADAAWFKRAGKLVDEAPRTAVTAVFHDLNHLHFLSGRVEVGRFVCELDIDEVTEAFQAHNWPWRDQDPYLEEYLRSISAANTRTPPSTSSSPNAGRCSPGRTTGARLR